MRINHTYHWKRKRVYFPEITDYVLEYAIMNSPQSRDKHWIDALNAVCKVPTLGRKIKVVYKRKGDTFLILTAFWL